MMYKQSVYYQSSAKFLKKIYSSVKNIKMEEFRKHLLEQIASRPIKDAMIAQDISLCALF